MDPHNPAVNPSFSGTGRGAPGRAGRDPQASPAGTRARSPATVLQGREPWPRSSSQARKERPCGPWPRSNATQSQNRCKPFPTAGWKRGDANPQGRQGGFRRPGLASSRRPPSHLSSSSSSSGAAAKPGQAPAAGSACALAPLPAAASLAAAALRPGRPIGGVRLGRGGTEREADRALPLSGPAAFLGQQPRPLRAPGGRARLGSALWSWRIDRFGLSCRNRGTGSKSYYWPSIGIKLRKLER